MQELVITFRESLEAALIVGIIFSYLKRTGQNGFMRYVYAGIFLGVLGSVLGALAFQELIGSFSGKSEMIFEGVTMVAGAALILYLIVWMSGKKDSKNEIDQQVDRALRSSGLGLMMLVFISILREGVETTLFLSATLSNQGSLSLLLSVIGIFGGLAVGYGAYIGLKKMNMRYLFGISSILLIVFAAGLFARGIHEFQEAGIVPTFVEHVWDINYLIDEDGMFGEFMKSLFGYNGNPSLLEVLVYLGSLAIMIGLYNKKKRSSIHRQEPREVGVA